MSRALRLVIALAIATPLFVSMGGPAVACSCVQQTAQKVLERADAVVAGHVVGEQPIDAMNTHSTLAVDGVYKGHVDATIVLNANIGFGGGSSCAVLYPVGSKADPLVLERLDDGTYQVSVCAFLSRAEVVRLLGSARPPPPGSAAPSVVAAAHPSTTPAGRREPAGRPRRTRGRAAGDRADPAVVGPTETASSALGGGGAAGDGSRRPRLVVGMTDKSE